MNTSSILFAVVAFGTALLLQAHQTAAVESSYGEICNETETSPVLCDKYKHLQCTNVTTPNRCECVPGTLLDTILEPSQRRCVAKANEKCDNFPESGEPPLFCTKNALCLQVNANDSSCFCRTNYRNNSQGACIASHGGECELDRECLLDTHLTCQNQVCACEKGNSSQIWDENASRCLSLIGADCSDFGPLVGKCVDEPRSECHNTTKLCQCAAGYVGSEDNKRCVRPYGQPCAVDGDCASGLQCHGATTSTMSPSTSTTEEPSTEEPSTTLEPSTASALDEFELLVDGTCQCPLGQIFDQEMQGCRVIPGASCAVNKFCVVNSQCDISSHTCICNTNFFPGQDRCFGNHGANCTGNTEVCSRDHYLTCSAGLCECDTGYAFKTDLGRCIGFIGSNCTSDDNCDATTSICQSQCQCKAGFNPTPESTAPNRTCLAGHDTDCSAVECDSSKFLLCPPDLKKCTCEKPADQEYDGASETCIAYADAVCRANDGQRNLTCVPNAECQDDGDSQLCRCKDNYHVEQRLCKENAAPVLQSLWLPIISLVALVLKMN